MNTVPGYGLLTFLFSIPVVIILIIRNIYLALIKDKMRWGIVTLHLLIVAIFFILTATRVF